MVCETTLKAKKPTGPMCQDQRTTILPSNCAWWIEPLHTKQDLAFEGLRGGKFEKSKGHNRRGSRFSLTNKSASNSLCHNESKEHLGKLHSPWKPATICHGGPYGWLEMERREGGGGGVYCLCLNELSIIGGDCKSSSKLSLYTL